MANGNIIGNIPRKLGRPSKEFIAKHGRSKAKVPSAGSTYDQKVKWCREERAHLLRRAQEDQERGDHAGARFYRDLAKLSTYEATYGKGASQLEKRAEEILAEFFRQKA